MSHVWPVASRLPLALLATLSLACAEPPDKELNQARGSIEAARAAGAERYAGDELAAAVAALRKAEDAVSQSDYRAALNHALDARERGKAAAREAAAGQAAARSQAEAEVSELERAIVSAREKLVAARVARLPARRTEAHRQTITAATLVAEKARAGLTRGEYTTGRDQLKPTLERLRQSTSAIEATLAARTGRRRR